jgi:transcriptional regulator with XRE-family HTH domain
MKRKAHYNRPPSEQPLAFAPRDVVLLEFSRRLQRRMIDKGWNQSDLARHAEAALNKRRSAEGGSHKTFGRDLVSNYIRASMLPGPVRLAALADALGCSPDDLLPAQAVPSTDTRVSPIEIKDAGGGMAWLRVNQAVPFSLALKIGSLLDEWHRAGHA